MANNATTSTTIPVDWDIDNPDSWVLSTTVDAHLGYHPTGAVLRELWEVRFAATDYGHPDGMTAGDDWVASSAAERRRVAGWWADVLGALHAAEVAIAEASPQKIAAAAAALGITGGGHDLTNPDASGDLEEEARHARRVADALAEAATAG